MYDKIVNDLIDYVKKHHEYRSKCINLIASENITSPQVRLVMGSDLGHRYAIGFLYMRMYRGCKFIDSIEELTGYLARKLFKVEHVNYIPISGTVANLVMFNALTNPGDSVAALTVLDGGHSSFRECSRVRGVAMIPLPFNQKEYNVDVAESERLIRRVKPKIVLLGASDILFPHPVKELREIVEEYGGILAYDAAHVLGLIAGGKFQDPLREGAEVVTGSTHKTLFGPQGGIILCRRKYSSAIDFSAWQMVNNHHIHRVAGLAITLCEFLAFGEKYADQVVRNAKALAENLYNKGLKPLCPDKGFTESHQVIVDVGSNSGVEASLKLEEANIIVNPMPLPWDPQEDKCSGIRLGVQEVTRLGMCESEMDFIADRIASLLLDKETVEETRRKVSEFMEGYQKIHYCFDDCAEAYRYL